MTHRVCYKCSKSPLRGLANIVLHSSSQQKIWSTCVFTMASGNWRMPDASLVRTSQPTHRVFLRVDLHLAPYH